jgi:hypothetical protein
LTPLNNKEPEGTVKELKPQQVGILAAMAFLLLAWLIPGAQLVVLPLQYLNTHLHEMGHALSSVFTGGSVDYIHVYKDGSGVTLASMNHPIIVASGGYVGASLFGSLIIAFSRNGEMARKALLGVFGLLAIECLFWLRGDAVGMISGFVYMLLFLVLGLKLRGWSAILVAQFVGVQQCLVSLQSVFGLVNPRILHFTDNDATILQGYTHVPAILWSVGWAAFSVILMIGALWSAWSTPKARRGSPAAGR